MIKGKGAGMVMTIILVSVCGWVAIVAFVIKPNIWVGGALCLVGGSLIGLAISYLMRRWWFRRIKERGGDVDWHRQMSYVLTPTVPTGSVIDPYEVDKKPRWDFGTRLQNNMGCWHYARAGEELKKGTMVEAGLSGRLVIGEPLPEGKEINELIYGDVKPVHQFIKHGIGILGWPLVNVKKYHYCWLQEPPPGTRFEWSK